MSQYQTVVGDCFVGETLTLTLTWQDEDGMPVVPADSDVTLRIRPEGGLVQAVPTTGGKATYTPAIGNCNHYWRAEARNGDDTLVIQDSFNVKPSNV